MKLCLVVQYNYNGSVSIAEPVAARDFNFVEVCTAKDVETAKQRAKDIYSDYDITFIDDNRNLI